MNLNSLKIATDGYLKRTVKATLIIAVAGYLNFGADIIIPPNPNPIIDNNQHSFVGGVGWDTISKKYEVDDENYKYKIRIEDSEIVAIVELTLKTFII